MPSGSHGSPSTETTSAGEEDGSLGSTGNIIMLYGYHCSPGTKSTSSWEEKESQGYDVNYVMASGSPGAP